ncbi:Rho GTPase-activating protein 9 [Sparganum proliferum]
MMRRWSVQPSASQIALFTGGLLPHRQSEGWVGQQEEVFSTGSQENEAIVVAADDSVRTNHFPWVAAKAPTGEQYFYDPESRISVWELPDLASAGGDEATQGLSPSPPPTTSRMSTSFTRSSAAGAAVESSVISTIDLSQARAKFGARQQSSPSGTTKGTGFTFFGEKKRQSTDSLEQVSTIDEADGRFSVQRISRDHITGPIENKLRGKDIGACGSSSYSA